MKYQTYTKYKPSGVEWIGDVPDDWSVRRLKFIKRLQGGFAFKSDDFAEDGVPILRIGDIKDKICYNNCKKVGFDEKIPNEFLVNKYDVLIALTGATIGKVGIIKKNNGKAYINQRVAKISSSSSYYYYLLKSDFIKKQIELVGSGSAQENISNSQIEDFVVPFNKDQQKIANFLDLKTKQIDELIKKDKRLIELLKEKRIAMINKAVTKGLDDKAKLVDSGVDWIGEIPEGWEVRKLKFIAKICNGQDQKNVLIEDGGYPIFGTGGEFGRASKYLYNKKSVLLGRKGTIDKPQFAEEPFWTVDTLFYTRIKKDSYPKFFYYITQRIDFYKYSETTTVPSMTQEKLNEILLPCPTYNEQKEIAKFLDIKINQINDKIKKVNIRIQLFEEYKKSLIYNAVTGKIKV